MATRDPKLIFAFNKFFYDMIKDLKTFAPSLKSQIVKNYTVRNNESHEHFDLIESSMTLDVIKQIIDAPLDNVFAYGDVSKIQLVIDITLADILLQINNESKQVFLSYVYVFAILISISRHDHSLTSSSGGSTTDSCSSDESPGGKLFMAVMHTISAIQKDHQYLTLIENIIDDDIVNLIKRFANSKHEKKPESIEDMMQHTQIASLAKEIAQGIDLQGININSPEDILTADNGNMIGKLVSQVGSKLQEKFSDGSMKQDDLIKEAMSMMSMMGGQNMFGDLLKSMGNVSNANANNAHASNSKTKDRLKKKLELKK